MKLEDSEAKYIISYTPGDIVSMREAMHRYIELLNTGNAFYDDYCVAHFEPTTEYIGVSFFQEYPLLMECLRHSTYYNDKDSDKNLRTVTLTETLFFMCAAKHAELELDLKIACQAIVAYARKLNDSSEMWITCEIPFGMEPLYIVASVYPKYGYLLASFYVPYWDDEHMPEALFQLAQWTDKYGITEHTLKAFCYCDNSRARENVLGYDSWDGMVEDIEINPKFDLITHFRSNADAFEEFKALLVERFQTQPFLQTYSDGDNYNYNPVQSMVMDIMMTHYPYDTYDDDFDYNEYLTQKFVFRSAEEEIEEINKYITDKLGRPIVPNKSDYIASINRAREEDDNASESDKSIENWKSFITGAFSNGKQIWGYIVSGSNEWLLDEVNETNIHKLSRRGKYAIFEEIDEHAYSFDDIHEELHEILENLFSELQDKSFVKNYLGDADIDTNLIIIRFLDVLFRWCGQQPFHDDFIEMATSKYNVCSHDYFNKRYAVNWQMELKQAIDSFSGYTSEVKQEQLESCMLIINNNRAEACEYLPKTILAIFPPKDNDDDDDDDYLKQKHKSSEAEYLCVAIYLYSKDIENKTCDSLTEVAKTYIEHYAITELLEDIHYSTEFPKQYIIDLIEKGASSHFSADDIEKAKIGNSKKLAFNNYIIHGKLDSSVSLSNNRAKQQALSLLHEYLEYDDEISDKQKQINWLRGFTDKTYKLLLVAHIGAQLEDLSCTDALKRVLSVAFSLAPVRVCHILAKYYNNDRDTFDNHYTMLNMLDKLKQQGLSDEGYWGYQMGLYACRRDIKSLKYYQLLLDEWVHASKSIPLGFMSNKHKEQRMALLNGVDLLPRSTQLDIVNDAQIIFPNEDLSSKYNRILIDKILRVLQARFTIEDAPVYFKNRLQYEGVFCEYYDWDKWHNNNDVLEQILTKVELNNTDHLSKHNCVEQLHQRKGWGYIVVKKQDNNLIPVYGDDIIFLLQNGFNAENIYSAQTNAIIIDETCPQEHIDELVQLSEIDYRLNWIERIISYISGKSEQADVENILRHGISSYQFIESGNFFDVKIDDLIMKVDHNVRLFTLKTLGMISPKTLDIDTDLRIREYYDLLIKYRVDRGSVFKFLLEKGEYNLLNNLALKTDISTFVINEKIDKQIKLLSVLVHLPQYHPLILSLENAKSIKLQTHVKMLIEKYSVKSAKATPFSIVDYGVYTMKDSIDAEGTGAKKVVSEPHCINKTNRFKGEQGMTFGLRFTATNPNEAPKVSVHNVTVKHPQRDMYGDINQGQSSWQQNGYSSSKIFMGWYFDAAEELLTGIYTIAAHDTDGNLLAEMTFNIE